MNFWRAHAADFLAMANLLFWLAGALSAMFAAFTYFTSRRKNAAELLLKLEDHFAQIRPFLPMVDPATIISRKGDLGRAIAKTLKPEPRTDEETALLAELDRFLRFLLVGKAAVDTGVIKLEQLKSIYDYWYWAAQCQSGAPLDIHGYVGRYFPRLSTFLDNRFPAQNYPVRFRELTTRLTD